MDATKHQSSLANELTNVIDQLHVLFDDIGLTRNERDEREASVYQALNDALQSQLRLMTQCVTTPPAQPLWRPAKDGR